MGVVCGRSEPAHCRGKTIDVVDVTLLRFPGYPNEIFGDQSQDRVQCGVVAASGVGSSPVDGVGNNTQACAEFRNVLGTSYKIVQLLTPCCASLPLLDADGALSVPRTTILLAMQTHVVDHPLAAALLTTMRDARSDNATFRSALRRLTHMLVYEAMRDAEVEEFPVSTPVAATIGIRLSQPPLLVPVLRAGLGMVEQASALIPSAGVGFVGMARDEKTHEPVPYLESLPADLSGIPVFVLDPMLATGGSMVSTIDLLVARGATDVTAVCVVAAPRGVEALAESGHPVRLVLASIDDGLDENAFIVPGLGDAGDRQFGPR